MTKTRPTFVVLLLTLTLAVLGCTGQEESGTPAPPTGTPDTVPEPPQDEDVAIGPAGMDIRQQGVMANLTGANEYQISPLMTGTLKANSFQVAGTNVPAGTTSVTIEMSPTSSEALTISYGGSNNQLSYTYTDASGTAHALTAASTDHCFQASDKLAKFFDSSQNGSAIIQVGVNSLPFSGSNNVTFTSTVPDATHDACFPNG